MCNLKFQQWTKQCKFIKLYGLRAAKKLNTYYLSCSECLRNLTCQHYHLSTENFEKKGLITSEDASKNVAYQQNNLK